MENKPQPKFFTLEDEQNIISKTERVKHIERELENISEHLCGVKVQGEITHDMVYSFVEGEIEKQYDLRVKAQDDVVVWQREADITIQRNKVLTELLREYLSFDREFKAVTGSMLGTLPRRAAEQIETTLTGNAQSLDNYCIKVAQLESRLEDYQRTKMVERDPHDA